jgi:hypothetical protein
MRTYSMSAAMASGGSARPSGRALEAIRASTTTG